MVKVRAPSLFLNEKNNPYFNVTNLVVSKRRLTLDIPGNLHGHFKWKISLRRDSYPTAACKFTCYMDRG